MSTRIKKKNCDLFWCMHRVERLSHAMRPLRLKRFREARRLLKPQDRQSGQRFMGATTATFSPLKNKKEIAVLKSHSNRFGTCQLCATYVIAHVQNQDISASELSCFCHPLLSSPLSNRLLSTQHHPSGSSFSHHSPFAH